MTLRSDKVGSRIQEICALVIAEQKTTDRLLTIVDVIARPDLRSATIYISSIGRPLTESEQADLLTNLQHQVAHQLTSKFTPRLALKLAD